MEWTNRLRIGLLTVPRVSSTQSISNISYFSQAAPHRNHLQNVTVGEGCRDCSVERRRRWAILETRVQSLEKWKGEGESRLHRVLLWPLYTCHGMCAYIHTTHTQGANNKIRKFFKDAGKLKHRVKHAICERISAFLGPSKTTTVLYKNKKNFVDVTKRHSLSHPASSLRGFLF